MTVNLGNCSSLGKMEPSVPRGKPSAWRCGGDARWLEKGAWIWALWAYFFVSPQALPAQQCSETLKEMCVFDLMHFVTLMLLVCCW